MRLADIFKNRMLSVFLFLLLGALAAYSYFTYKIYFTLFNLSLLSLVAHLEYSKNGKNSVVWKLYSNSWTFLNAYVMLAFGSLVGDYLFGIVFKGWIFANYHMIDYFLTVFIGYPCAGLVFVHLIYLIKCESDRIRKKMKFDRKKALLAVAFGITAFVAVFNGLNTWYALIILFIGYVIEADNVLAQKGMGLWNEVKEGEYDTLFSLILATVIFGIATEGSNLGVYDWKYTNVPFEDIKFFGISLFVLVPGWIGLGIFPLYVYRLVSNGFVHAKDLLKV